MNVSLRDGSDAYLMIGSPADCHKTAVEAAQQAVRALNGLKPAFGLILVDVAWYMLMQARVDAYFKAIQDTLGPNVPIAGGYTLGQIIPAGAQDEHPQFLNQNVLVAAFAERE